MHLCSKTENLFKVSLTVKQVISPIVLSLDVLLNSKDPDSPLFCLYMTCNVQKVTLCHVQSVKTQGPVVQSIISLTSSLRVISLTV